MFAKELDKHCGAGGMRFVSLGSGNCDLEVELARYLKERGRSFTLECLDLNPAMLERGRRAAEAAGVVEHLRFVPSDLNSWTSDGSYDAVMASQSLHHVVNLEHLFDQVKRSLRAGGNFLISDMIGRNGHQRWPEALAMVHELWRKLPPSYRFNELLNSYEELYRSWDCSVEGFEGVRAQDILPLLLERFPFRFFFGYGNLIDPFVDRAFGGHFDPATEWDRAFLDAVHARDEEEIRSGRLTPTHMIAIVANEVSECVGNLSPQACVRSARDVAETDGGPAYDWTWPHDSRKELEIACARLAPAGDLIRERTQWALGLKQDLAERTEWAISLEKDVAELTAWARGMEAELKVRTEWAQRLDEEVEQRTRVARELRQQVTELEREVEERTLWALRVKDELAEQSSRAQRLEAEIARLIHNPWYLARRLMGGVRNRLFRSH